MGMPISLALRGRHADDTPRGDGLDRRRWPSCGEADRVFSTYRADSVISRLGRGEIALADCPPEVAEVLALGEAGRADSGGAFAVRPRRGPRPVAASSRAGPRNAPPRTSPRCPAPTSASPQAATSPAAPPTPPGAPWRIGIEDPHDPSRLVAVVPVHTGAVATSGTARRGAHIVDARTGRPPTGVASVTVIGPSLTAADIDATAAFALGPDAVRWLRCRGRTALVVHTDCTTTVVAPEPPR